jgi:hypothetical protein
MKIMVKGPSCPFAATWTRVSCTCALLLVLQASSHHEVDATKAALKALTGDAFIRQDKSCMAFASNEGNTLIHRAFHSNPDESNFNVANAARESELFYVEMSSNPIGSSDVPASSPDQAFQIRVGQGGQIYSLSGAYGEAMPPNSNVNEAFVKDVCQMVAVGTSEINQAGSAILNTANTDMNDSPFWSSNAGPNMDAFGASPSAAVDCSKNSCRMLSWGQPFRTDESQDGSSALFYTRYTHCGNGVLEVTNMVHNMADAPSTPQGTNNYSGAGSFHTVYSPAISLRHSTFQDVRSGDDISFFDGNNDTEKDAPLFVSGAIVQMVDTTTGYTVFTEGVSSPTSSAVELPCVSSTGTRVACDDVSTPDADQIILILDPDQACTVETSLSTNVGKTVISCSLDLTDQSEFGYETRYDPITLIDSSDDGVSLDTDGIWCWGRHGKFLMFFNTTNDTLEDINAKLGYGVDGGASSTLDVVFDTAQVSFAGKTREDSKAIAIVHGTTSAQDARGKTFLRLGQDLPASNDALKLVSCLRTLLYMWMFISAFGSSFTRYIILPYFFMLAMLPSPLSLWLSDCTT